MIEHRYALFLTSSVSFALIPLPDMAYLLARCVAPDSRARVHSALGLNSSSYGKGGYADGPAYLCEVRMSLCA